MIKEIRSNIGLAIQIIIISLLMGLLDNLKSNFSADGVNQIAFYVCYIVLVTLIIASFVQIYDVTYDAVVEIEKFMKVLIPIIFGIIVASGGVTISSIIYPVLAFGTELVTIFMTNFLLPISMIAFALGIISNVGNKVSISRLPSLLKSVSLWCMGIVLTIFIGILSLEGTIASTVDGVTVKTAKFLFSGSIPVVGKLLGDSIDVILGSTLIIKDAIGFIGIAVLFGMALVPIIKVVVVIGIYQILSAIIEPFSDKRICKCLSDTAEASKMLLGIVVCVTVMFMIGTVMLLKMSNFVSMHG
jgi:stage III sporulation protein AE